MIEEMRVMECSSQHHAMMKETNKLNKWESEGGKNGLELRTELRWSTACTRHVDLGTSFELRSRGMCRCEEQGCFRRFWVLPSLTLSVDFWLLSVFCVDIWKEFFFFSLSHIFDAIYNNNKSAIHLCLVTKVQEDTFINVWAC